MTPRLTNTLLGVLLVGVLVITGCHEEIEISATVADLQVVHEGVELDGESILQVHRVGDGAAVETKPQGRARLRLDDGTKVIVDGNTKMSVGLGRVGMEQGRIFVVGATGARTTIDIGDAKVAITGGQVGVEANGKSASVYAASGDLVVNLGGKDHTVQTGESARLDGTQVKVEPERVYDDWTGGLAAPWSATGQPSRVVGALWGASTEKMGDPGSPLTIRSQDVSVKVVGETAQTQVHSTFFHAGSSMVHGDYRLALPVDAPADAIVSGFSAGIGDNLQPGRIGMAGRNEDGSGGVPTLEWAGDGWVRASFQNISPGQELHVVVQYVQWLKRIPSKKGNTVEYRFPLASDATPPMIGEFSVQVDTTATPPRAIRSGHGARVADGVVVLRKSDFRPTADFVVELELDEDRSPARMYVTPADHDEEAGSYVMVRAEAPTAPKGTDGVRLAVILDTSASMDAGAFDAARGFVEALITSLGGNDQVVVLSGDTTAHPIGPDTLGVIDDTRRKSILDGLSRIEPGGASDLGVTMEAAADLLDPKETTGMVVYVGDGWPSVGDLHANEIRARLSRRPGGTPRLAAVSIGPRASRFGLATLVRGSGPWLHVEDQSEGAEAASMLLAEALQPSVAEAQIDLGPDVEQVYPLRPRAVVTGRTLFAVGRTRANPPRQVVLRWRGPEGPQKETLKTHRAQAIDLADIRKRWASERVQELALRSRGREAVTDVALREKLLTPWTGWTLVSGSPPVYQASPMKQRVLHLRAGQQALFSAELATPSAVGAALLDLSSPLSLFGLTFEDAVRRAAKRKLDKAIGEIRACRDSRAALRPDLTGVLSVSLHVDGNGRASNVQVEGSRTAYDQALLRCVASVIEGLSFPASGLTTKIKLRHTIELPPGKPSRRTKCSSTSRLPLSARRGVWQQRLRPAATMDSIYREAKQACELPNWRAKRSLLELMFTRMSGSSKVKLARKLEVAGEKDAADFFRREALRRARTPVAVKEIRAALLADEGYPIDEFKKRYKAARTHAARLAVVQRFLGLAPHDVHLRRQQLILLAALDDKEALRQQIALIRRDPLADATLLAEAASALHKLGEEAESLRAFGEIVERAPRDPWARAFAGDRLRREGWFDEATLLYAPLEQMMPTSQPVTLRMALAHAGAGRIDLAGRMLTRITQTAGRSARSDLSNMAADLAAVLLLQSREGLSKAEQDELRRRAMELPNRPLGTIFLVRCPSASPGVSVVVERGPNNARVERKPLGLANTLNIHRLEVGPKDENVVLRLVAKEALKPAAALRVRIDAIIAQGQMQAPILMSRTIEVPQDGKKVELSWERLQTAQPPDQPIPF